MHNDSYIISFIRDFRWTPNLLDFDVWSKKDNRSLKVWIIFKWKRYNNKTAKVSTQRFWNKQHLTCNHHSNYFPHWFTLVAEIVMLKFDDSYVKIAKRISLKKKILIFAWIAWSSSLVNENHLRWIKWNQYVCLCKMNCSFLEDVVL